jgi:hypothetical protein
MFACIQEPLNKARFSKLSSQLTAKYSRTLLMRKTFGQEQPHYYTRSALADGFVSLQHTRWSHPHCCDLALLIWLTVLFELFSDFVTLLIFRFGDLQLH